MWKGCLLSTEGIQKGCLFGYKNGMWMGTLCYCFYLKLSLIPGKCSDRFSSLSSLNKRYSHRVVSHPFRRNIVLRDYLILKLRKRCVTSILEIPKAVICCCLKQTNRSFVIDAIRQPRFPRINYPWYQRPSKDSAGIISCCWRQQSQSQTHCAWSAVSPRQRAPSEETGRDVESLGGLARVWVRVKELFGMGSKSGRALVTWLTWKRGWQFMA